MPPPDVLFVFGTRPEAAEICPQVLHLQEFPDRFRPRVCVTGQHCAILGTMLARFRVTPEFDLDVIRAR